MQRGYIRNPSPSLINVERHHGSRLCSTGAESSTGPRDSDFQILRQSVLQHFQTLPDPRVERTQHHSLMSIVTIAILAVLAGADGFVAIERYGKAKQSWLETFLELPHGIPSHDTLGRVIGALDPQAFY